MKLILTSANISVKDAIEKLAGKPANNVKTAVVVNAFDNYPSQRRSKHVDNLYESLHADGVKTIPLDLRDYYDDNQALVDLLKSTDMLWVSGGNVFYLRYVLKMCGLDKALKELLDNGLIYGGGSAGAAVLGHDMHGIDLLDDPAEAPELIYSGLNITPFMILPHWGNERYAIEIANTKAVLVKNNKEVVAINDDQACIVDGDSRTIIG